MRTRSRSGCTPNSCGPASPISSATCGPRAPRPARPVRAVRLPGPVRQHRPADRPARSMAAGWPSSTCASHSKPDDPSGGDSGGRAGARLVQPAGRGPAGGGRGDHRAAGRTAPSGGRRARAPEPPLVPGDAVAERERRVPSSSADCVRGPGPIRAPAAPASRRRLAEHPGLVCAGDASLLCFAQIGDELSVIVAGTRRRADPVVGSATEVSEQLRRLRADLDVLANGTAGSATGRGCPQFDAAWAGAAGPAAAGPVATRATSALVVVPTGPLAALAWNLLPSVGGPPGHGGAVGDRLAGRRPRDRSGRADLEWPRSPVRNWPGSVEEVRGHRRHLGTGHRWVRSRRPRTSWSAPWPTPPWYMSLRTASTSRRTRCSPPSGSRPVRCSPTSSNSDRRRPSTWCCRPANSARPPSVPATRRSG